MIAFTGESRKCQLTCHASKRSGGGLWGAGDEGAGEGQPRRGTGDFWRVDTVSLACTHGTRVSQTYQVVHSKWTVYCVSVCNLWHASDT